jgi:hypothetical protein
MWELSLSVDIAEMVKSLMCLDETGVNGGDRIGESITETVAESRSKRIGEGGSVGGRDT